MLAGPRGWNEDIDPLVAALGDRVHAVGFVAPDELRALYAGAEVFCFPSLAEGFGLPVLEAMAQATPVVTSAGTATAEVAGDAGILVDPRDPDALAEALDALLADPDGRARRGEAGRRAGCGALRLGPHRGGARRRLRGRRGPVSGHGEERARPVGGEAPDGGREQGPGDRTRPEGQEAQEAQEGRAPRRRGRARVGVNLLWIVPGEVGGSEEHTVRLLGALAEAAPDDLDVRLYVNRSFPAAHPELVAALPTVVAPVSGRSAAPGWWPSRPGWPPAPGATASTSSTTPAAPCRRCARCPASSPSTTCSRSATRSGSAW